MFLDQWLTKLGSSLSDDLTAFIPELILCVGIIGLLLARLFRAFDRVHLGAAALTVVVLAFLANWVVTSGGQAAGPPDLAGGAPSATQAEPGQVMLGEAVQRRAIDLFGGMLVYDNFMIFMRYVLFGFTGLTIWLTLLTGIPDREDSADFYCLLLGALLGMSLMASANHLLMVYIAVEMASLPSYGLAGFLKGKRQSSEAALKYVVFGGGASGVMLYGISLLAGKFGTGYLPDLAQGFARIFQSVPEGGAVGLDPILILGTLFILIGVFFKLAAFPFHFWCPDVFEGAAAEVAGFLSVASKAAALALLARISLELAGLGLPNYPDTVTPVRIAEYFGPILGVFAALTATFGNLAAYYQTNLKRLLAYSTIAQAGYMMMGLTAFRADGAEAVLFYLVGYLFMNLGAFAIVAFLRNQTGSEDLSSFRGIVRHYPFLVVTFAFFLFSLVGVPPLVGFAAKFQIFAVLFNAGNSYLAKAPVLSYTLYALLVIGGINTVISLVYYINVLKVMILDTPLDDKETVPSAPLRSSFFAGFLAAAVLFLGVWWNWLGESSKKGASPFLLRPTSKPASGRSAGG
jgi:NADH-quinone oxidoreductase subunit N